MSKPFQINSVMMDLARVTEKHAYYRALPERLAAWGCNAVFLHFTDDEGCAMEFKRRPELATPHAFSKKQMTSLIRLAARHGITAIPEIEAFGHTGYIHGRRKYNHLTDTAAAHVFNALNPLHRESKAILRDLVEETADVFADSPWIHAGLDEVNFGGSEQVRRALRKKEKWQIFADHIEFMRKLIEKTGKRMIMWGDHLLHEPRIADNISTDIVIADWHYQRDVKVETMKMFLDRGFDVIACPASNRSGDMILPNALTQVNLQRFSRIAHSLADTHRRGNKVLGMMNTVWCPMRMLCGIEQFAIALGGAWCNDPEAESHDVTTRFLAGQYGLSTSAQVAEELLALSAATPRRNELRRMMDSNMQPELPLTELEQDEAAALTEKAAMAKAIFHSTAAGVKRNAAEFANFELAADILHWTGRVGLSINGRRSADRRKLHAEGKQLLRRATRDWNRGRHADDPKRDMDGSPKRWQDALIPNMHLAVARLATGLKRRAKK